MTMRRRSLGRLGRIAAPVIALLALLTVQSARSDAEALGPTPASCAGNPSFCGITLRIDSAAGTIPSVAAGAHYGPAWGIPTADNNSAGVGWCVDDSHTGFPVGPIEERSLPSSWTKAEIRHAATIITLFGGDRVVPYQPLRVDRSGELAEVDSAGISPTRHRQIAVWFALRSLLPDAAGTPRIDLDTASTFSDPGGRVSSAIGDSAVGLARQLVSIAAAMTANGTPTIEVRTVDGHPPTSAGTKENVIVHVEDGDGKALANSPVWPIASTNAAVTPTRFDSAPRSPAFLNAEAAGWPSLDATGPLDNAGITDGQGNATFTIEVEQPGPWRVEFDTTLPPSRLHLFGDGINAQNNVSILADEFTKASGALAGDVIERHVRVVKTSSDPTFGVAGAVLALIDANGAEIVRGTAGADGVVDFPPVGASHPTPLAIREITAPVGLALRTGDIRVDPDNGISTDSAAPTVVEVENRPMTHELVLQKEVTGAAGFGSPLSGFRFTVIRDIDNAEFGVVETDDSGRTRALAVPAGHYSIREIARPERWPGDEPLPDPIPVTIPVDASEPIVVSFENTLQPPSITTSAADRSDGDKYLSADGGSVVDHATVCGAVRGTTYTVEGQLLFVGQDGSAESTGTVTTAEFVASPDEHGCESIELEFEVPDGSEWLDRPGHFVVTEILFAESERVAAHDDLGSIEQAIFVAKVRSEAVDGADGDRWIDRGGGTVVETLSVSDLDPSRPDVELRAESTLMTIAANGAIRPTGASGSATFTVGDVHDGTARPTVEIPYSSANLSDDGGTGVVFTTIIDVTTGLVVAEHHDPDIRAQQVRWRPVPVPPTTAATTAPPAPPPTPTGELPRTGGASTVPVQRWAAGLALVGSLLFVASGTRRRPARR